MDNNTRQSGFFGLGIAPMMFDIFDKLGFTEPTPIQRKAIPIAIEGQDIIGIAQTGTGKTIAFGVPMIQRLAQKSGRGLVLAPTRELSIQIHDALKPFAQKQRMEMAVLIGGVSIRPQTDALRRNPRIIVATPGRLLDHISQNNLRLDGVAILVLDEADRMLDMGFAPQIERILKLVPRNRQTMLFSATMPIEIMKIASAHMHLPVSTEIAPSGTAPEQISQELFVVNKTLKPVLLDKLLKQYIGSVLLFTRTKRGARKVAESLRRSGYASAEIHANRSQAQRKDALQGFKTGKYRILVATDIASRGIDVSGIELVLNYDLPDEAGNYVHRIGRTGRAGLTGRAISFATPDQGSDIRAIEKIIRMSINVSQHPEIPPEHFWDSVKTPDAKPRRFLTFPQRRRSFRYR